MKIIALLIIALFAISCSSEKEVVTKPKYKVTPIQSNGESRVIGTVVDEVGESMPFVKVMLIQNNEIKQGVVTDIEGKFKFINVKSGTYDLEVNAVGYQPNLIKDVKVIDAVEIDFEMLESEIPQVISLKPVIYIYPEVETDVSVELNYNGRLTHTYPKYPKYPEIGWKVKAQKDGTLFDEKGQEYYALFWEGKPTTPIYPVTGFVISGNETAIFLEEKLEQLGLNRREANEFIMYWLPLMENNPFNLIHFSTEDYEDLAELNISPEPETVIRIMMITKPLQTEIVFPAQTDLKTVKERKGFTVVEWGGMAWPEMILGQK